MKLREWATDAEITSNAVHFSDMHQKAITKDGCLWTYLGTDAWFRVSGIPQF